MHVKGTKGKNRRKTCLRKKIADVFHKKHQQFFIEICTKVTMILYRFSVALAVLFIVRTC